MHSRPETCGQGPRSKGKQQFARKPCCHIVWRGRSPPTASASCCPQPRLCQGFALAMNAVAHSRGVGGGGNLRLLTCSTDCGQAPNTPGTKRFLTSYWHRPQATLIPSACRKGVGDWRSVRVSDDTGSHLTGVEAIRNSADGGTGRAEGGRQPKRPKQASRAPAPVAAQASLDRAACGGSQQAWPASTSTWQCCAFLKGIKRCAALPCPLGPAYLDGGGAKAPPAAAIFMVDPPARSNLKGTSAEEPCGGIQMQGQGCHVCPAGWNHHPEQ